MNEDVELLKMMKNEIAFVMRIFRLISISNETVVDINVELMNSSERANVLKLFCHKDAYYISAFR